MDKSKLMDKPLFLMAILLFLWGACTSVSKLILKDLDSFQLQFLLFGFATVILTAVLLISGKGNMLLHLTSKDLLVLSLVSVPSFLYGLFYGMALRIIPAVEASMLNYLFPIMIVIFSIPINHEKLNCTKIISIVVCFAGALVIITDGQLIKINLTNIVGDLLAFAAAVCWGLFSSLGKRVKTDGFISCYIYTVVSFLLSAIGVCLFSAVRLPDSPAMYAGIVWLSLSEIVLAYYLWFKLIKSASSSLVASLSFITPFVTLLFIVLILGETIRPVHLIGLVVIVLGIAVQQIKLPKPYAKQSMDGVSD